MQQWVLDAEDILGGNWEETKGQSSVSVQTINKKQVTNKEVGLRFDRFLQELDQELIEDGMSQTRSEEHTSELQSRLHLVCRLLLEKKKKTIRTTDTSLA